MNRTDPPDAAFLEYATFLGCFAAFSSLPLKQLSTATINLRLLNDLVVSAVSCLRNGVGSPGGSPMVI